jgi:hypothetical protein
MVEQATYMEGAFVQLMAYRHIRPIGTNFLDLTPEQASLARACGFAFFPATAVQVQRLTMQKRIFRLDGQPFLATRDGTYWETHGTLMRLIEEQERSGPQSVVEAPEEIPHPREIPEDARASAAGVPEITDVPRPDADPPATNTQVVSEIPTTRRRSAGGSPTRRPSDEIPADGDVDAPLPAAASIVVADSTEVPVEAEAAAPEERDAPAARQRRARKPKPPRSVTAGTQETAEGLGLEANPTKEDDASGTLRPDEGGSAGDGVDTPFVEMATDVPKAAEVPGKASGGGTESHRARVVRRPRLGQSKIPRWVTAGKERRGRLK